jgi:plasmid maintenance system antidote protein VapI
MRLRKGEIMKNTIKFKTNGKIVAIPPGVTIQELLEINNISVEEFTNSSMYNPWISVRYAENLLSGEADLGKYEAGVLEEMLGVDAGFWLALEKNYRKKIAIIEGR